MSSVIFAGPTLSKADIESQIDAVCLPPAAQGDLYRAARERPSMIGLIDGYFSGVPSVWHKEILWAMDQGIRVFGASSMGALRAAELHQFGMIGIGQIYCDYRDGVLEDDDEVAVLHGPAELNFMPLSEPMVSLRATLARAIASQVLSQEESEKILSAAKALHYTARTWPAVLDIIKADRTLAVDADQFADWLKSNTVDAKRDDALAMLDAMAAASQKPAEASVSQPTFQWTLVWDGLTSRIDQEISDELDQSVLQELSLDTARYHAVRGRASHRRLAANEARQRDLTATRKDLLDAIAEHRRHHRLARRDQLDQWLTENRLSPADYETLITEMTAKNQMENRGAQSRPSDIVSELKFDGTYAALLQRAKDKAERLQTLAQSKPAGPIDGPGGLGLLSWFVEEINDGEMPDDVEEFAQMLGYPSQDELFDVLRREYLYLKSMEEA